MCVRVGVRGCGVCSGHLAAAFELYYEGVAALKRHRRVVEQAMSRWRAPALAHTFALWREYMDMCAGEAAEEAHRLAKEELAAAAVAEREQAQAQTKREVGRRLDRM